MYFDSLQAFLLMGKHAAFVWSAFGITILSIVLIQLYARLRYKRLKKLLKQYKNQMN